jgi:hypothetical protein
MRLHYKRNMASQAVIEKTPLWFILFCLSSGLLITLSFPFDIFALNVQNGIVLTNTTPLTAIEQFGDNFKPFIMVKHLGDMSFPYAGLVEIILLGFVIGTLVYLFQTVYDKINGVVADNIRKTPFRRIVSSKKGKVERSKKRKLEPAQIPRFVKWLQNTNTMGYADFLSSTAKLTEGLLFGAETFFLLNIIRILVGLSHPVESMAWFELSLTLVLVFYYLYLINKKNLDTHYSSWVEDFKKVDC